MIQEYQNKIRIAQFLCFGIIGIMSCCKDVDNKENQVPIPEVTIDTNGLTIGNDPKIPASINIKVKETELFNGTIGIEYRGAASYRLFPKKSLGIETRTTSQQDLSVSLFGFPAEEDWILHAPYDDKTLIRNILSMKLSNQMGLYAPRTQLLELTINNEYQGVYVFMEKIKRNKGRVSISKLINTDNDPAIISGGYIIKIDKTAGDTNNDDWAGDAAYTEEISFRSSYDQFGSPLSKQPYLEKTSDETYFLYEYPDSQDISTAQKGYIKQYIQDFESAIANEDFSTSTRKYNDYIDVDTFVDYFILSELSHNADAYRLSTYFNKDRNGKLKMGPIWDMNLCYGADASEFRSSPKTWIYQYNLFIPNDLWLVPFWWQKLMQDPLFKQKVKARWILLRNNILTKENIMNLIDSQVLLLKESGAMERNFHRWPILGVSVPFNGFVGQTYDDEITYMKSWLSERLTWMDSEISHF